VAPCDPNATFNQGDRMKLVNNVLVPVSAPTDDWFGVSDDTNPVNSLGDKLSKIIVIATGSIVKFLANNGDTFKFGDPVYQGSDPQVVQTSNAGGEKLVGYVRATDGSMADIVGTGSNFVAVEIHPTQAGAP